jgi:hypothetical protein
MMVNGSGRMPSPLSPAVETLLAHERVVVPQPEMVRARLLARAREALEPTAVVRYRPRAVWSPMRRLLVAAAAGVVLMAGAAAAYQMLRSTEPTPPATSEKIRAGRSAPWARPALAPEAVLAPETRPERLASSAGTVPSRTYVPSRHSAIAGKQVAPPEELRLLVRARRADARHDYLGVLALAAEHERRHPAGRLSEEREVLRVKALVGLRRGTEARQVASKFRRRFPRSVLLHKIDDMLASLR